MLKHDRCPSLCANHRLPNVKDLMWPLESKAANKLLNITVVESTLNSFCTEEGKHLAWDRRMVFFVDLNKTIVEAYLFANFHVL